MLILGRSQASTELCDNLLWEGDEYEDGRELTFSPPSAVCLQLSCVMVLACLLCLCEPFLIVAMRPFSHRQYGHSSSLLLFAF